MMARRTLLQVMLDELMPANYGDASEVVYDEVGERDPWRILLDRRHPGFLKVVVGRRRESMVAYYWPDDSVRLVTHASTSERSAAICNAALAWLERPAFETAVLWEHDDDVWVERNGVMYRTPPSGPLNDLALAALAELVRNDPECFASPTQLAAMAAATVA